MTRKEAERRLQDMTKGLIEKMTPVLFAPVSMQQFATTKDTQARGPMWVSRTVFSKPKDPTELKAVVREALGDLAPGRERVGDFSIDDVKVQWTSFKPSSRAKEPEPSISEQEKYGGMMQDITTDIVALYAHGGFYYSGSPASVRGITLALAQETGGRCLVPEYRLSPQNTFPAAIIDLLLAYLTLLYPSESSMHAAVSPQNIVFAGDSSGGNLVLSLLALVQHIRDHNNGRVPFGGKMVDLPLPAGIATLSPHCDHTNSFDSHRRNKPYDIFNLDLLPHLQPYFPACDLWPTSPPREDIYCDGPTLLHPLVSVSTAPSWSAANMPPMFFACGQENLEDEAYYLSQRAAKAGTIVQFLQYDALPHNFALFIPRLPQSLHVLSRFGSFCREVVKYPGGLESERKRYPADDAKFLGEPLDLPVSLDEGDRKRQMQEKVAKRKPWTGPVETANL
ncbi:lipase/esteras-like protein [Decorospora gaudefroyi]|uniref:Lipase/esteras-like protein n=1 Tax=Decorospora gaudefroyi TaxID=184978 RepID=A0A6A5KKM0_9PLEO|nr:lipase/esteras-like protein [Decorospora gaudefroyi]